MGVHAKTGRCRKLPEIQSQDRDEGVPTEEGCGLRRDICPGSKYYLHPNGAEYSMNLEVELPDVKTTFLHGDLEEEIYM